MLANDVFDFFFTSKQKVNPVEELKEKLSPVKIQDVQEKIIVKSSNGLITCNQGEEVELCNLQLTTDQRAVIEYVIVTPQVEEDFKTSRYRFLINSVPVPDMDNIITENESVSIPVNIAGSKIQLMFSNTSRLQKKSYGTMKIRVIS